ncbi:uncharacterized protein LOC135165182 isoform X2 [Diachasmimorpha longicaudata]|uniref:uncharacterized protein LOC135165182 isoform X2 n=1 Tax=Diachasmimorpha longicaudata TaxID=58733 RepID=UPI0030B90BD4
MPGGPRGQGYCAQYSGASARQTQAVARDDCTREDDKMAPRFCTGGDLSRYHLRTPKQRRSQSSIDAATVSNKIDFLRCMGLDLSTPQEGFICDLCQPVECFSDLGTNDGNFMTMKDQPQSHNIPVKPCRVLIIGDECKVCKKLFKCETDVRDHMKKRHKHRLKVILKLNNKTVSTKWIKRSHLKRRRSHSDSHDGYRQEGNQLMQKGISTAAENSLELRLRGDESSGKICRNDSTKTQDDRPCSAPSLGVSFDLPLCRDSSCRCCVRNNVHPWDDNNNYRQLYLSESSRIPIVNRKNCSGSTVSCQTPQWLQKTTTSIARVEDNDVIPLNDSEDMTSDITEIPVEPPCYDLDEDSSDRSDDEVEKVLEVRKNQSPFITIKREPSDSRKDLRISDAIRDLMSAENSLSSQEHEDPEIGTHDFYNNLDKTMESDDEDEEDNFTLRFDDDEESCTFIIKDNIGNKEFLKGFSGRFFEDTHLDVAVDHHDALEQSSVFWNMSRKIGERFSSFERSIEYTGKCNSLTAVKEELNLDHYLFPRE